MLARLRSHHIKRIFIGLIVVIIPVFIFWGGSSLRRRKNEVIGEIAKRKISFRQFNEYLAMSRLHFFFILPEEKRSKVSADEIKAKAWQFLLLTWKAEQEKIKVSDREVVEKIKGLFGERDKFDKKIYRRFLRYALHMQAPVFEKYLRRLILVDKLLKKHTAVKVEEAEVKNAYKKKTQKAKIAYIFIPYAGLKDKITFTRRDLEKFFNKNKERFRKEAKTNGKNESFTPPLEDILGQVTENFKAEKAREMAKEICEEIISRRPEHGRINLKRIARKKQFDFKKTGYFKYDEPVKGIGLKHAVNAAAFSLKEGEVYPRPLLLEKGAYIVQLAAITPFDQNGFKKDREGERRAIYQQKYFTETLKFMIALEKEAGLKIYSSAKENL